MPTEKPPHLRLVGASPLAPRPPEPLEWRDLALLALARCEELAVEAALAVHKERELAREVASKFARQLRLAELRAESRLDFVRRNFAEPKDAAKKGRAAGAKAARWNRGGKAHKREAWIAQALTVVGRAQSTRLVRRNLVEKWLKKNLGAEAVEAAKLTAGEERPTFDELFPPVDCAERSGARRGLSVDTVERVRHSLKPSRRGSNPAH